MTVKNFLIIALFFCGFSAHAQFKKGTRMIGAAIGSGVYHSGNTTYTYPSTTGYSTDQSDFSISISPSYGIFINDHTVIGVSLLVNSAWQRMNNKSIADTIFSSSRISNTDLGLGTFLRYYFTTGKSFNPFLHPFINGGTGFGHSSGFSYGSDISGTYKDSYDGKSTGRVFLNMGLNIGVTKEIGRHVALDAFTGYLFSYSKYETETSSVRHYLSSGGPDVLQKFQPTQKFTGNGISIGIGLQVFLDR